MKRFFLTCRGAGGQGRLAEGESLWLPCSPAPLLPCKQKNKLT